MIADLDSSDTLLQSYSWGLDLSGSFAGAGGVGGLLKVEEHGTGGEGHYVSYDGNGNVAALVSESSGTITARYEYGPFGEVIRATGAMAANNPFQFSTKFVDLESGFSYYGMRYYNPATGMFISRDPIGEEGGLNLYGFVGNSPISKVDPNGLYEIEWEGTWSRLDKRKLRIAFGHVRRRVTQIMPEVRAEIGFEKAKLCPRKCYIDQLEWLSLLFDNMITDIDGNRNLELYRKPLDIGTAATAWRARTVFDAELSINTGYNFRNSHDVGFALDAPNGEAYATIFHELTHLSSPYADDGESGIQLRNAHELERLWDELDHFGELTVVKGARRNLYPCED